MKILFLPAHYVFDDHEYGTEPDLAYNIVHRVAEKNQDSVVVTGRKNLLKKPVYRVIEVQPNTPGFNMSFVNAIKFNLRYTRQAFRLLKTEQFDIMHHVRPFNVGATFNLAALIDTHKNIPFVIGAFCIPYGQGDPSTHDRRRAVREALSHNLERLVGLIIGPLSDATLRRASVIFVVDHSTQKLVQKRAPEVKIVVVPPGKDKSKYFFDPSKKYRKGDLTFLSAGNFIPRKGFDKLIESFSKIAPYYPNARLKIVGNGFEETRLRVLTEKLGLSDKVVFTGRVPNSDMPAIYETADVYAAMPQEEAMGHTYIEALAAGLPVIATNTNGSREILADKPFGRIIAQGNLTGMAASMRYFLEHPKVIAKLAIQARDEFEKKYDWGVVIPKYTNEYEKLAAKSNQK
jgi:glycosyltransferase involved in cell wall biosynthesis